MQSKGLIALVSVLLVIANAFFVAAEYALIGARRSRIEAFARRRKRDASWLLNVLDDVSPYVAATQIGITMVGIAVGSITEPYVNGLLMSLIGRSMPRVVSFLISYLLITYLLVVIGELCPKYLSIKMPERVAVRTTRILILITRLLTPIVWLAQASANLILRPFGVHPSPRRSEALPKDELLLLIRAGSTEGIIEQEQADVLTRALRLDRLDAEDIMIHRMDMRYLDADMPKDKLFERLAAIPYSRIPVCEGDVDNLLGIAYVHDIIKAWNGPEFSLRNLVRPAVIVPQNLTAEKILTRMRETRCQIVIVADEYGGTSGLITLEDVVEEVFGELEDQIETERPPIERLPNGRITARADVRYDELAEWMGEQHLIEAPTETLATIIVNDLGRIPKLGDQVDTALGTMYVENMARRRITRVSFLPKRQR